MNRIWSLVEPLTNELSSFDVACEKYASKNVTVGVQGSMVRIFFVVV